MQQFLEGCTIFRERFSQGADYDFAIVQIRARLVRQGNNVLYHRLQRRFAHGKHVGLA